MNKSIRMKRILAKLSIALIWQNTNLIDSYVFGIYKGVPYPFNWYVNASMVDEAVPIQNPGY